MENNSRVKNYFPVPDLQKTIGLDALVQNFRFDGTEVFLSSAVPREQPLFTSEVEKSLLLKKLKENHVKRVHLSYWAEPCDFLDRQDFTSLLTRFSTKEEIASYYSDLTGNHIYNRWLQEYEVAKNIGAEAVTFHAIDYFHIDGLWTIKLSKKEVLDSFGSILNRLISLIDEKELLEKGPTIEIENAGFGLETGVQTAEDYVYLLSKIKNKRNIGIGWDTNHLLHALGLNTNKRRAYFLLDQKDKTSKMKELEELHSENPNRFFQEWIEQNVLNKTLLPLLGSIHLSDLKPLTKPVFLNGRLIGKCFERIINLNNPSEQEEYGTRQVLKYYDSHLPIGESPVDFPRVISGLKRLTNGNFSILHELKNSNLEKEAYESQIGLL